MTMVAASQQTRVTEERSEFESHEEDGELEYEDESEIDDQVE